ncbi:hypothetical protein GW17_00028990, partial [Ensete ventricosum]
RSGSWFLLGQSLKPSFSPTSLPSSKSSPYDDDLGRFIKPTNVEELPRLIRAAGGPWPSETLISPEEKKGTGDRSRNVRRKWRERSIRLRQSRLEKVSGEPRVGVVEKIIVRIITSATTH